MDGPYAGKTEGAAAPPRPRSGRSCTASGTRINGARQVTDVYLLALAVHRGGRLATFDRSVPLSALRGAGPEHVAVAIA